jgi:exopolysaccharide production protein ExoY
MPFDRDSHSTFGPLHFQRSFGDTRGLAPSGGRSLAGRAVVKWMFDKSFAILLGLAVAPFLALVLGVVYMRGGGNPLFSHRRIGRGGVPFNCLKVRTMGPEAQGELQDLLAIDPIARKEWETSFKLHRDPRVDAFGAFLRKSSLDELPQLWNILRGDMSVVGPRPITEAEADHYGRYIAEYAAVRPGLTGAWQVSGRSDTSYAARVMLDVSYVRNWSLSEDLRIVFKTVSVVVLGKGAV